MHVYELLLIEKVMVVGLVLAGGMTGFILGIAWTWDRWTRGSKGR